MSGFEQKSNDWLKDYQIQLDNEAKEFQKYCDQKLDLLRKNAQDKLKKFNLENIESLKNTIDESNKEALELFYKALEHAKTIKYDNIREMRLRMAKRMYQSTLESNKANLDKFIRDFGNL